MPPVNVTWICTMIWQLRKDQPNLDATLLTPPYGMSPIQNFGLSCKLPEQKPGSGPTGLAQCALGAWGGSLSARERDGDDGALGTEPWEAWDPRRIRYL